MARTAITMPNLGFDTTHGVLVAWLKAVGDHVDRGEAIAEVETEKATVEMEAQTGGTIVEIVQPGGTEVEVGAVIAWLEGDD
jgi:pyruvate/2-oxoglutarate dehydrogenase complex dihydrolipoamide acyltransferase (E2) component